MAIGQWFCYNKKKNIITLSSVDFLFILPFINGRNFKVEELVGLKDNEEVSLLNTNEPAFWIQNEHHIDLSNLLEENNLNPICSAKIELENGGLIKYDYGVLFVKYPQKESLKDATVNVLKSNGYFAANMIWDFCLEYQDKILLDFFLCKHEKDISDDFQKIINYNLDL